MSEVPQAQHVVSAAHHFGTFEKEAHATRFGMWIFLASEMLLFAGLITLYSAGRVLHPEAFDEGIGHNLRWLGSINTLVLITSSFTAALAVHAAKALKRGSTLRMLGATAVLGLAFLGFKSYEYAQHLLEGAGPGGETHFFAAHPTPGLPLFFSLYYLTTGAHAVHVIVGLIVICVLMTKVFRRVLEPRLSHHVELGALYWHLVDVIWIFLWPLYYLTGGRS
jgi:cytochrome c oxidase subunit 3